jgi:hypothetical protein
VYNKDYYDSYGHDGRHYLQSAQIRLTTHGLTEFLCRTLSFKRHLDVGCAFGLLVDMMRRKGKQSFGIDISEYAINNALPASKRYVWQQDIVENPISEKYDLITCVEVIEHIPAEYESDFLDAITRPTKHVFFSSENNTLEPTHVNCNDTSYWVHKFMQRGFVPMRARYPGIPWGRLFRKANRKSDEYAILDEETRYEIHVRDKFLCVLCGKRGVQIHEIVPRSFFGSSTMWQCFQPKNRISLCPACHSEAHTREERKRAMMVMSIKYGYTYEEDFYQQYQEL